MALKNIRITYNAQRTDNSYVFSTDLSSAKPTRAEALADIQAQLVAKRDATQGNVDELNALVNG